MQLFLIGYIIVSICEIFTIGGFPLDSPVRRVCRGMLSCQHQLTNFAGLRRCPPRRNSRDRLDPHVERLGWLSTP
jgi:hypothetical protein